MNMLRTSWMWLVKTSPNICLMIQMVKDIWKIFAPWRAGLKHSEQLLDSQNKTWAMSQGVQNWVKIFLHGTNCKICLIQLGFGLWQKVNLEVKSWQVFQGRPHLKKYKKKYFCLFILSVCNVVWDLMNYSEVCSGSAQSLMGDRLDAVSQGLAVPNKNWRSIAIVIIIIIRRHFVNHGHHHHSH